jgi:hypothetical protein
MFDTFRGLPMHAIVVHATVVFLPLMALVTVVVAVIPRLRRYAWWVVALDFAMVVLTGFTAETGQAFQARLGGQVAQRHAQLAGSLIYYAAALFVTAVLVAVARRVRVAAMAAALLSVVAAGALVFWTVQVGEAGAQAVWGNVMGSTSTK